MRRLVLFLIMLAGTARADVMCTMDDQYGCRWLAVAHAVDDWPPFRKDRERADNLIDALFRIQQEACRANNIAACSDMLATLWRHPARDFGAKPDPATAQEAVKLAIQITHAACERGDALACLKRSLMHPKMADPALGLLMAEEDRLSRAEDIQRFQLAAEEVFSEAVNVSDAQCRTGNDHACAYLVELGFAHEDSLIYAHRLAIEPRLSAPIDPMRMISVAVAACDDPAPLGCRALTENIVLRMNSSLREAGQKLPLLAALHADLTLKCELGIGAACFALGHLAETSQEATQNLTLACNAGHPEGCLMLGYRLYKSFLQSARAEDLVSASSVMEIACAAGRVMACDFLRNLSRQ